MDRLDEDRWADIHTFHHPGLRFDPTTGAAEFDYTMQGSSEQLTFTDVISFPVPEHTPDSDTLATLHRVLELLYVAVGTIYYKSIAPRSVALDTVRLAPATQRWAEQLYRRGLAEFAYRWSLPHVLELDLVGERTEPRRRHYDRTSGDRHPLVAIGGGKDSAVSLEALTNAGFQPATFAVERRPTPLLGEMMSRAGGLALPISRTVDGRLTHLLSTNSARIGHVPVTAINSLIGVAAATLHGLGPVVMSNERSADEGNLVWYGREVNHQWSKGLEAEELLRGALSDHAGLDNACFSLLRGVSELHIARLFAATSSYDNTVTSCNYAFRMSYQQRGERWCHECAKCRFVFLALAPFMDRARLVGIFGQDLLDDDRHVEGYRELLGLTGHKPFECVGGITESRVALQLLVDAPSWSGARVVGALSTELLEWPTKREVAAVLAAERPWFAPPAYARALSAMQAAVVRDAGYFQRKCTKTLPKFFGSFSTRWY
jgi:hypothetical protein